ncbi:MAG: two-component regulator propeller domain-containing protein [Fidelibacterota bacterium]
MIRNKLTAKTVHLSSLLMILGLLLEPRPLLQKKKVIYDITDWISYLNFKYVTSITVSREYVYFGTTNGILRYHRFRETWDFPFTTSSGLPDNIIYIVAYDKDTQLLWAVSRAGLSYFHDVFSRWKNISKSDLGLSYSDRIFSIGIARNIIWLETTAGYIGVDKYNGSLIRMNMDLKDNEFIEWSGIRKIKKSSFLTDFYMTEGYIFIPGGTIMDPNFREFKISYWVADEFKNLWCGIWGLGPAKGDLRTRRLELLHYGPATDIISSLAMDEKNRSLWIGGKTSFRSDYISMEIQYLETLSGITEWHLSSNIWKYYESQYIQGLRSNNVNVIKIDNGTIWFGKDRGLTIFFREEGIWKTFTIFDNLTDDKINDIEIEVDSVWIATDFGINTIQKKSLLIRKNVLSDLIGGKIYDILIDGKFVWFGTDNGIFSLNRATGTYSHFNTFGDLIGLDKRISEKINSIDKIEDSIFFATERGITQFSISKKVWKQLPLNLYLIKKPVKVIEVGKDFIWAGTELGLFKYNRKKMYWRHYTVDDGLANNQVNSILLDGNYLWIGTSKGLTKFLWNEPSRLGD